jgi:hypothetical protein
MKCDIAKQNTKNDPEVQMIAHLKAKPVIVVVLFSCFFMVIIIGIVSLPNNFSSPEQIGDGQYDFFTVLTRDREFFSFLGLAGEINTKLLIVKPGESFFGTEDGYLDFLVMNKSGEPIVFPDTSYGVRAFEYDNQWIEIELGKYPFPEPYVLSEYSGSYNDLLETAYSIPKDRLEKATGGFVRLFIAGKGISGNMYQAYTDYSYPLP